MKTKMTLLIAVMMTVLLGEKTQTKASETAPPNMALIPAGPFQMGDTFSEGDPNELPTHTVYVSPFYIDKYKVSNKLWGEVRQWATNHNYNLAWVDPGNGANYPVYKVTWYDAIKWCNARSEKEGRVPAYYTSSTQTTVYHEGQVDIKNDWVNWNAGYRLPTEAEWEKAARGGLSGKRFPWGDTISHSQANYYSSDKYSYDIGPSRGYYLPKGTSPVDYFAPNGYGLYDMAGNLQEWCWDWYGFYPTDAQYDPRGPISFPFSDFGFLYFGRIVRGGSWGIGALHSRTASRGPYPPFLGSDNSGFRTVLPSTALDPIRVIQTQPVQPTYSDGPKKEDGKDSLVLVTHGWQPILKPIDISWVDSMTNTIRKYLVNQGLNNWQVVAYKWAEKAHTPLPESALDRGKEEGVILGRYIASQGFGHVHLIGHSAGAGLIQTASETIKALRPDTLAHLTFLDAFVGFNYEERGNYGKGANWSDSYFSRDFETSGEIYPFTESQLEHAYNVDVTYLDPHKPQVDGYISTSSGISEPCRVTKTTHGWPIDFYANTIMGTATSEYQGFGFPLSKEGGNWDYALNNYTPGNKTPHLLGTPDPPCFEYLYTSTPAVIGPTMNFSDSPTQQSLTGLIQKNGGGIKLTTDSPAWLATFVTVTNPANLVSFDAEFVSVTGAQGLLSVYWDTNTIGSVDERAVQPGLQHYSFGFPRVTGNSSHVLGFRVDPFTNIASSVIVTNVSLGLVGPDQPFSLVITTNKVNGLQVYQLNSQARFNYTVETSTNLIDWKTIAILVNTNGVVRFIDPNTNNAPARFYRAVVP